MIYDMSFDIFPTWREEVGLNGKTNGDIYDAVSAFAYDCPDYTRLKSEEIFCLILNQALGIPYKECRESPTSYQVNYAPDGYDIAEVATDFEYYSIYRAEAHGKVLATLTVDSRVEDEAEKTFSFALKDSWALCFYISGVVIA